MMIWTVKDVIEALKKDCEPDELIAWSAVTQSDAEKRYPHLSDEEIEEVMCQVMRYADDTEPVIGLLADAYYETHAPIGDSHVDRQRSQNHSRPDPGPRDRHAGTLRRR